MHGNVAALGANPVLLLRGPFFRLAAIGALALLAVALWRVITGDEGLAVVGTILAMVLLYLLVDHGADLVSAHSAASMFRRSREQVRRGAISPDWVLRSADCAGLVAVDERARRLMVNGVVRPFSDVTLIRQRAERIEIALAGDPSAFRVVTLDGVAQAEAGVVRLAGAVGIELTGPVAA